MTKKTIRVRVDDPYKDVLEGKVENVIKYLQTLIEKHGPTVETEFNYGDDTVYLEIYATREETDSEYQSRINLEERQRLFLENQERLKYEELKKKFG